MSFINRLSHENHMLLRRLALLALQRAGCPSYKINNRELDKYIEQVGPQTMERVLKAAVDAKLKQ
jgi:hypothetical protein